MVQPECMCKLIGLILWFIVIKSLFKPTSFPPIEHEAVMHRIATFVLVNGLLCHGTAHPVCIAWDVLGNAAVLAWINAHTAWQPHSFVCTALLLGIYAVTFWTRDPLQRTLLHVFLVQGLGAILLVRYR